MDGGDLRRIPQSDWRPLSLCFRCDGGAKHCIILLAPNPEEGGGGGFEMNGNYFKTNRYAVHIQLVLLSFAVVEFSGDLP